jgi:hypothetical protein
MSELDLLSAATQYFERQGYAIERDVILDGNSGTVYTFELQAKKKREVYLVNIRQWNRTVGVNMVIKIDRAVEDVGSGRAVLVANRFSDHARSFSARRGILLLTPREFTQGSERVRAEGTSEEAIQHQTG